MYICYKVPSVVANKQLNFLLQCLCRTPAMIGCSFVVDREYFGEIGLLDPGMEVYGGENIELGMRVSSKEETLCHVRLQRKTGSPRPRRTAI